MDAHSGGMSGSESNSNFATVNSFDLTNFIKRSLSSISRFTVHSGPLEHQLAPAIQHGNYRHATLDRRVDKLDYLIGTDDQTRPRPPSATPSSAPTNNLNNNLVSRRIKIPLDNLNTTLANWRKIDEELGENSRNLRIGAIVGIILMLLVTIAIFIYLGWRYQQDRKAEKRQRGDIDIEAPKVVDEHIPAPPDDGDGDENPFADPERPEPIHNLWARTSPRSPLTLESHPMPDRSLTATPERFYRPLERRFTDSRATSPHPDPFFNWRSHLPRSYASVLGRTNPFHDRNALPTASGNPAAPAEIELSENHDDGLGGTWVPHPHPRSSAASNSVAQQKRVNQRLYRALRARIDAEGEGEREEERKQGRKERYVLEDLG